MLPACSAHRGTLSLYVNKDMYTVHNRTVKQSDRVSRHLSPKSKVCICEMPYTAHMFVGNQMT
jgi:hypothetical protein